MPEAAINEHSKTSSRKYEIRPSEKDVIATPTCDAAFFEEGEQSQFSTLVSLRLNGPHDIRPLQLRENVRHFSSGP
jgi:hypothetical protein